MTGDLPAEGEPISEDMLLDSIFDDQSDTSDDAGQALDGEILTGNGEDTADLIDGAAMPEGEASPDPEPPQSFTVTIDGKEESVSLDELRAGYMRQTDHARHAQEVAQARKALDTTAEQLKERLAAWAIPQEQEPDWVQLAQTTPPQEYQAARAQWEQRQLRAGQARQMLDRIQAQEHSTLMAREQAALLERLPEWRNPEAARADLAGIVATAADFGFTEAEVTGAIDHRLIVMARELSRLKTAQAALEKAKATPPAPKATIQGRNQQGDAAARNAKLLENLKRNKSDDAAVAFLLGG